MNKEQLKELLSQMTIEEKLGQLTQTTGEHFVGKIEDEMLETGPKLEDLNLSEDQIYMIGSVLGSSSAKITNQIQESYLKKNRLKIPLLFMHDAIHGYRTIFPIPLALSCSFNEEVLKKIGSYTAKELRAAGIHVNFSPMVDLVRDARWGRVMESFGEDHILSGNLGRAMIEGYQKEEDGKIGSEGVAACLKHFAAYGAVDAGKDYASVDMSLKEFFGYYAKPYEIALSAKPRMVMSSFNSFNGVPATASKFLLKQVLRDKFGFKDLVISDWGSVTELKSHGIAEDEKAAGAAAFEAGVDIEMVSSSFLRYGKEFIGENPTLQEQLDKAVMDVLNLKNDLGLFEHPFTAEDKEESKLMEMETLNFSKEAAKESCVLLKNNQALPIRKDAKNIVIVGPFANSREILGNWMCKGKVEEAVSLFEGMKQVFPNATIKAFEDYTECSSKELSQADFILVTIGERWELSGEGHSSTNIDLPAWQQELVRNIKNLNVALNNILDGKIAYIAFSGRPLALDNVIEDIPALLWCWYPGTMGGAAIAELVAGIDSPSGKLTMSFPRVIGQVPMRYNELRSGKPANNSSYSSRYQDCGIGPLFSFGHGLSYGDIAYSGYRLSKQSIDDFEEVILSMEVINNSNFSCKETVLLYMEDPVSLEVRPVRELLNYKKIELKAGEEKTVQFAIHAKDLMYINGNLEKALEPGVIRLYVNDMKHPVADLLYQQNNHDEREGMVWLQTEEKN